jgi:hypothetical protein
METLMFTLRSLKPNVTRAEAIEKLSADRIVDRVWRLRRGPLRSVADVYLPYRLYRVEIVNGARPYTGWFALEAVSGLLDLYQFDHAPDATELVEVHTRNRPALALDEAAAARLLLDKLRRTVFQLGFFRVRNLVIRPKLVSSDIHVPYWVGFYGRGSSVRLRVLDAVRRQFEGGKARALLGSWLVN